MGEIKSTLDLALERLKKIGITEKEREEIKQKEIHHKAVGFSNRFMDGSLSLHEIQKEIERMDENTKKRIKEILLAQLIEGLSLKTHDERLFAGIEWLKEKDLNEIKEEFQNLLIQFEKEKEEIIKNVKDQLIESLRRMGIQGSAIDVNIESSNLWRQQHEKLNKIYQEKLNRIKDKLKV